jgi:hypothetical protein
MSITYYECVAVALVIQHEKRMRRIVVCGLSGSVRFFHIIYGTIFRKKKKLLKRKICVLIFSTIFSQIFLILRQIREYISINAKTFSCKVCVILIRF